MSRSSSVSLLWSNELKHSLRRRTRRAHVDVRPFVLQLLLLDMELLRRDSIEKRVVVTDEGVFIASRHPHLCYLAYNEVSDRSQFGPKSPGGNAHYR